MKQSFTIASRTHVELWHLFDRQKPQSYCVWRYTYFLLLSENCWVRVISAIFKVLLCFKGEKDIIVLLLYMYYYHFAATNTLTQAILEMKAAEH